MFYFFYFLECGSTITLKSLVMTTSRTSVGLFLLCVDFSVFFFFSILLYIPFALVFFVVLWALFLQNCLQNQLETSNEIIFLLRRFLSASAGLLGHQQSRIT